MILVSSINLIMIINGLKVVPNDWWWLAVVVMMQTRCWIWMMIAVNFERQVSGIKRPSFYSRPVDSMAIECPLCTPKYQSIKQHVPRHHDASCTGLRIHCIRRSHYISRSWLTRHEQTFEAFSRSASLQEKVSSPWLLMAPGRNGHSSTLSHLALCSWLTLNYNLDIRDKEKMADVWLRFKRGQLFIIQVMIRHRMLHLCDTM